MRLERLEPRKMLAATSIGVTPLDTGEFLLGTVAVTPVFFESDGSIDPQTQDWSPTEIQQVLTKVQDGVEWWSDALDALNSVHSVDFVFDNQYALNPFETGYEPIDRGSSSFQLYVGEFLASLGYGGVSSIEEAVRNFNHDQRVRLGTDWAFTIFVADSSDDPDGLFAAGGQFAAAFAFAGGLFYVSPSTRPVSTFTHEMGHIFWARDEYPDASTWTARRGYYDAQNWNAADNPTPGFVQDISIMRGGVPLQQAFDTHFSPESTLAMIGWRDSDSDGVFDVADVPLEFDAWGYFDAETSQYHLSGSASAAALLNQNSSGPQSDITFNRISELQYRLDGGTWLTAATPDEQEAVIDVTVSVPNPFSTIEWRVIDETTGVTSPVISGTNNLPAIRSNGVSGFVFLDTDSNGQANGQESGLASTLIAIRHADGSPLLKGSVLADDYDGELPSVLAGVAVAADGLSFDSEVASFESVAAGGARVFHAFNWQFQSWINRWDDQVAFEATFDEPVGQVSVDAIGLHALSYVRVEAFDESGSLVARSTSEGIVQGQSITVSVADPLGRIARIRAFGHAETDVALSGVRFGIDDTITTDHSGAWSIPNLADGTYQIEILPQRIIHQFESTTIQVDVVDGTSDLNVLPAQSVDSFRHNGVIAEDVNGNGEVAASDALTIINDLGRLGARLIQPGEFGEFYIDVNNDGAVSALDALHVINYLGSNPPDAESLGTLASVQLADSAGSRAGGESNGGWDADSVGEDESGLPAPENLQAAQSPAVTYQPRSKLPQITENIPLDTQREPVDDYLVDQLIASDFSEPFRLYEV